MVWVDEVGKLSGVGFFFVNKLFKNVTRIGVL